MNIREFFRPALGAASPQHPTLKTSPRADTYSVSPEIIIYRRDRSTVWQCRFKLRDGRWHRLSTGCVDADQARVSAITLAEQWAVREELGLPVKRPCFSVIARAVVDELRGSLATPQGKVVYRDYIAVLERYLIPFFGRMAFEEITPEAIADFDSWRNTKLRKTPRASTLRTHASAFNRVVDAARSRGLLAVSRPAPALTIQGRASEPRPSFTQREIDYLLEFLSHWSDQGEKSTEKLMRPLLRDYVEFLLYTGIRHGTESMRLRWQHLQWHWAGERRYLRIWVSGKTGPRYLIAKAGAVETLERLALRVYGKSLDTLIDERDSALVFTFQTGHQPRGFEGAFKRLMRHSDLLKESSGKNRTLYSLRHTYATFALQDGISIHTIARQMGTSVVMLEKHYSKLTPMMNAAELGS
jgi:integrase